MSEIAAVKTNKDYSNMFGKSFKGKIIKRKYKDEDVVCVQEECGCVHWLDASWLEEAIDCCDN